jgi:hypothetical protein
MSRVSSTMQGHPDPSMVPNILTEQIPIVTPRRERVVQWEVRQRPTRATRSPASAPPDCPDTASFPWTVIVDGGQAHFMNTKLGNTPPKSLVVSWQMPSNQQPNGVPAGGRIDVAYWPIAEMTAAGRGVRLLGCTCRGRRS